MVVVAAVAAFKFGPEIARSWQKHDRNQDIRSSVVKQMSDASAGLVVAIEEKEFHSGKVGETTADYISDFRKWEVERQSVAVQLRTYFGENIERNWLKYGQSLLDYYNFETDSPARRTAELARIETYLRNDPPKRRRFPAIEDYVNKLLALVATKHDAAKVRKAKAEAKAKVKRQKSGDEDYNKQWRDLINAYVTRRGEIAQTILDAPIN